MIVPGMKPDDAEEAEWFNALADQLFRMCGISGLPYLLDAAVAGFRRAADDAGSEHPEWAIYMSNLAVALRARFERGGRTADVEQAVGAAASAVDGAGSGHPDSCGPPDEPGGVVGGQDARYG